MLNLPKVVEDLKYLNNHVKETDCIQIYRDSDGDRHQLCDCCTTYLTRTFVACVFVEEKTSRGSELLLSGQNRFLLNIMSNRKFSLTLYENFMSHNLSIEFVKWNWIMSKVKCY